MYYDAAGRLTSANIADGKPRSVAYTLDENAQIIRRDETKPTNLPVYQTGSPHEVWYRFGGREVGYVGNNGNNDPGYTASIDERQDMNFIDYGGTFRNGAVDAHSYSDFAQSYDPINSYSQGAAGGSYTVRTGDTLQSVAQAVWGDSSLWYKLAEANGITGNAGLIEGQVLQLPAGVIRNTHNATTANPYNPAEAIGDLSPTMAAPPKKAKGCGGLGMILLAVVAIAVTLVLKVPIATALNGGAAASAGSAAAIAGGGLAAAVGSVASQAVGLATGMQNKFSFKGVALAAVGGGFGAGIGGISGLDKIAGSSFLGDMARGALGSAVGQGVGVATGLQSKFDFAGVAAAAMGAGIGGAVARDLPNSGFLGTRFGNDFASTTASAIAGAATRSAIQGSSFGDNLMRALPDAIGQTMGRALAGAIGGAGSSRVGSGGGDIRIDPSVAAEIAGQLDDTPLLTSVTALNNAIMVSPVARGGVTAGQYAAHIAAAADARPASYMKISSASGAASMPLSGEEIVVIASRQSLNDHRYISDAQFLKIDRAAQMAGWEPAQENAYIHQVAVSNMFRGQFAQPPSLRSIGSGAFGVTKAFAGGAWDTASGFGYLMADAVNPGGQGAWERNTARYQAIVTGQFVTAPVAEGVNALASLFDHDNPTGLARMAGGGVVGFGAARVAGGAGRVGAAESEFVGPLIGKSGFRTSSEFADAVGARYQGFVDDAYIAGQRLEAQGLLRGHPDFRLGNYVDRISQRDLSAYLRSEGISEGPGSLIQLNRYLRDPAGSGLYVRPDVRIPAADRIFDATVGFKAPRSIQITGFRQYSGGNYITVTRPSPVGGSYSIVP